MYTHIFIYLYINIIYIWIISIVMNHFIAHWEVYSLVPPKHIALRLARHLTSEAISAGCDQTAAQPRLVRAPWRAEGHESRVPHFPQSTKP